MKKERISNVISKADHWPIERNLEYLHAAYEAENDNRRRARIHGAMRELRNRALKQEIRNERS